MCPGDRPGKANRDRVGEGDSAHSPGVSISWRTNTSIIIGGFECMQFRGRIIEPVNMNSSN